MVLLTPYTSLLTPHFFKLSFGGNHISNTLIAKKNISKYELSYLSVIRFSLRQS